MASSGFKGSCDYYNKPGTKRPSVSNFCASMAENHCLRAAREDEVGAVYISRTFTITPTATPNSNRVATVGAPNRNRVATAGAGATPAATASAAPATDVATAAALKRVEPTRQSQPRVCLHPQSSPPPRLLRLLPQLLRLLLRLLPLLLRLLRFLPRLLRLLSRRLLRYKTSTSRLHQASVTRFSQAPSLRA